MASTPRRQFAVEALPQNPASALRTRAATEAMPRQGLLINETVTSRPTLPLDAMKTIDRRHTLAAIAATLASPTLVALPAANAAKAGKPEANVAIKPTDALLVIDVQNCFLPGGSLAVNDGQAVIPVIHAVAKQFKNIVLTQDWHTADHVSFASQHAGKKPFDVIDLPYGKQVLWPDHCVQGSEGAALHKDLDIPQAQLVIRKEFRTPVDSYSAFLDADRKTETGLRGHLTTRGIKRLFVAGLATDFVWPGRHLMRANTGLIFTWLRTPVAALMPKVRWQPRGYQCKRWASNGHFRRRSAQPDVGLATSASVE